jgi:hypothetical protein
MKITISFEPEDLLPGAKSPAAVEIQTTPSFALQAMEVFVVNNSQEWNMETELLPDGVTAFSCQPTL